MVAFGLQQAQAHLLAPIQFQTSSPLLSGESEATFLIENGYNEDCCQFLAKWDKNNVISGDFSSFFTVTMTSGNTWTITWDLTDFELCGVLIKDGAIAGTNGDQLYRFYDVSSDELTNGSGTVTFDNPVKNISHVSFFGCPSENVPDGGMTVTLMGLGLSTLGIARRVLMG